MENTAAGLISELQLPPGFRFHPTDEELVVHYLSRKISPRPYGPIPIIADVNLYKFDPWDLPQQATFGEKEWYFFSPRDKKYPNGARPNRAAASGYWKATGTDKPVLTCGGTQKIGIKKALVFYTGRAPRGVKTNWIMHEYRLAESDTKASAARRKGSLKLDDWVLCRIYKKKKNQKPPSTAGKLDLKKPSSCTLEEDVLASLPDIDDSRLPLPRLSPFAGFLEQQCESFPQNNINPYVFDAVGKGQSFHHHLENNQRNQSSSVVSANQTSAAESINLSLSTRESCFLPGFKEKYESLHNVTTESFKQQPHLSLFNEDLQDKSALIFSRDGEDDAYKSVPVFPPFLADLPQFFQPQGSSML
ncbi:hypothetical protein O6H91_23G002700 [Diphasiastrum complanatum]|uniref:Uncharacterized protein n=1 Tax=Diphasiastrum complanatum TaxID=34168 RepID=A0ACC2A997_DIPCM|nr:hypothetical protein O6H91_23G002700 [Diphasiastrum complanatum]